jgi:hypothetical protein
MDSEVTWRLAHTFLIAGNSHEKAGQVRFSFGRFSKY